MTRTTSSISAMTRGLVTTISRFPPRLPRLIGQSLERVLDSSAVCILQSTTYDDSPVSSGAIWRRDQHELPIRS